MGTTIPIAVLAGQANRLKGSRRGGNGGVGVGYGEDGNGDE